MSAVVGLPASPAAQLAGSPAAQLAASASEHPGLPPVRERSGHSWEPASACGPGCLPAPGALPRVSRPKVVIRLVGFLAVLVVFALAAGVYPLLGARRRARLLRRLFRAVLRAVGVRLVHTGADRFDLGGGPGQAADEPGLSGDRPVLSGDGAGLSGGEPGVSGSIEPAGGRGVLVVANHLSWLDILALGAVQPMRVIAKREIRDWPVIGSLAVRVGTLFVDRSGLRSLPAVVAEAAEALRSGAVVGLFPEGTTWCGAACGPFRRAGFQAALDAGVPVRPVAQRMRLPDGTPTTVGAFIGADTLLDALLRVVRLPELVLEVEVLPALHAEPGVDRRELARRAELAISAATGLPAPTPTTRAAVRRPAHIPAAA